MATITAVERHKPLIIVAILAAISGGIAYRILTTRRGVTGSPEDVPMEMKPVGVVTHAVEQAVEFAIDKVTHGKQHSESPPPVTPPVSPPVVPPPIAPIKKS
jgi:hypothetical protein